MQLLSSTVLLITTSLITNIINMYWKKIKVFLI